MNVIMNVICYYLRRRVEYGLLDDPISDINDDLIAVIKQIHRSTDAMWNFMKFMPECHQGAPKYIENKLCSTI